MLARYSSMVVLGTGPRARNVPCASVMLALKLSMGTCAVIQGLSLRGCAAILCVPSQALENTFHTGRERLACQHIKSCCRL